MEFNREVEFAFAYSNVTTSPPLRVPLTLGDAIDIFFFPIFALVYSWQFNSSIVPIAERVYESVRVRATIATP